MTNQSGAPTTTSNAAFSRPGWPSVCQLLLRQAQHRKARAEQLQVQHGLIRWDYRHPVWETQLTSRANPERVVATQA